MPTGRDAKLVTATLEESDVEVEICSSVTALDDRIGEGAGAILLAEEALRHDHLTLLAEIVKRQPVWSDLPVILLSANAYNSERLSAFVGNVLNITIMDRPLQKAVLISAVKGALRARERQYQTRDLLEELKETDRQKDQFLASLSHELRTPLNSMLGWIRMLRTDNSGLDRHHALEVIERNARAQTQIINDILTLSRVVTGKLAMDSHPLDLVEVIRAAVDVVQPSLESKQIDLKLALGEAPIIVNGDFDRLQQVFWNLLSNAVKFTPENGTIKIVSVVEPDRITITVTDTGKGIDPEFLPYAFERFRQADTSFTRKVGGLGLGLAIVRTIIEQHHGTATVTSEGDGRGATFTVTLPRATATNPEIFPPVNTTSLPAMSSSSRIRILLAEDDDDARDMMSVMLRMQNLEVTAVSTATAALESIAHDPPTLLISDVGMPDLDGYALIEKIRQLPAAQGGRTPAIALTGYAGITDRARSMKAGFQAHLAKPIDFNELFEAIERLSSGPRPTTDLKLPY